MGLGVLLLAGACTKAGAETTASTEGAGASAGSVGTALPAPMGTVAPAFDAAMPELTPNAEAGGSVGEAPDAGPVDAGRKDGGNKAPKPPPPPHPPGGIGQPFEPGIPQP